MTWNIIYQSNRLVEKYGVLGKVASRYVLAGYSVRIQGNIILASRGSNNLVIAVATNDKEVKDLVSKVLSESKKLNRKPLIVLYGRNKWRNDTVSLIREHGISYRMVRE